MHAADVGLAGALLGDLAAAARAAPSATDSGDAGGGGSARWRDSGPMALTGAPARPLQAPEPLTDALAALGRLLRSVVPPLDGPPLDPFALLGERAAFSGNRRAGRTSCGGNTRLLRSADDWLALSLARPDDVNDVPALLALVLGDGSAAPPPSRPVASRVSPGHRPPPGGGASVQWPVLQRALRRAPADQWVAAAALLGLPVGRLAEARGAPAVVARRLVVDGTVDAGPAGSVARRGARWAPVVVDLSSLWAGPLCAQVLGLAGASVVKVESVERPDGARAGAPGFFDLLHAGHRTVALDFSRPTDRARLGRLVGSADIVIEGSRPRALAQLGIDAPRVLANRRPRVWVSLTGHGRAGRSAQRVGFGDDAAVAGGLVARDGGRPCFCADAVADPLAGMTAALAAWAAWCDGGRWLVDVAMSGVAATFAAALSPRGRAPAHDVPGVVGEGHVGDWAVGRPDDPALGEPRARPSAGTAPPLGADTGSVLAVVGPAAAPAAAPAVAPVT